MNAAPMLQGEPERIAALREYRILDTPPEPGFDNLVKLAAEICQTPTALVSLVDQERQWFKAKVGLDACETSRQVSFCAHTIQLRSALIVPDAQQDERFAHNPLVTGKPHLRFYAGIPLINPAGYVLGSLCVIDYQPRHLTQDQLQRLQALAEQVVAQLELRKTRHQLTQHLQDRLHHKPQYFFSRVLGWFALSTAILIGSGVIAYRSMHQLAAANQAVGYTEAVVNDLQHLDLLLDSIDTVQRGYVLTGDRTFLESYQLISRQVNEELTHLQELVLEKALEADQTQQLQTLITRHLEFIERTFATRQDQGLQAARTLILKDADGQGMDQIRQLLEGLQQEATNLQAIRFVEAQQSLQRMTRISTLGIVVSILILIAVYSLIYQEIMRRREVEVELSRERDFISAITDTAAALVMVTDPQGRILRFNKACETLTGYRLDQVKGQLLWELNLIPPEEIAEVKTVFRALQVENWLESTHETAWLDNAGKRRQISWANTTIQGDAKCPRYLVSIGIDISERKRAEQELQRQHQHTQLVAELTLKIRQSLQIQEVLQTTVREIQQILQADRVVIFQFQPDRSGCVVTEAVVPNCLAMLGLSFSDSCFQQLSYELYRQGRVRAIPEVEALDLDPCHRQLLQRFRVRASVIVPIRNQNGLWGLLIAHQCHHPRQWQTFEVDLLKQLSDQVGIALKQAELLQRETLQRQQLAQQNLALEAAHQQAEKAVAAKSTFLATMSHEIRTPLNAVLGMTGLLLETPLNSDQQDCVETIRLGGDTLLTLINDILDFSKLEAGEMELEILNFDLVHCLEELADLFAGMAHAKGLEIGLLIEPDVPRYLRGDLSRLRQILSNLVSNAVKFTRVGEVTLHAEQVSQTETTATLTLSVTDTGIGIAPADQIRLFQPFSQVDASTTRKYGGTGLGLAISRQLVDLMGGQIGIDSQEGQGSCFWITLTFEKQTYQNRHTLDLRLNHTDLQGKRLLVVDDNATSRKIIRTHATQWGLQVIEADSGDAALQILHQYQQANHPIDLALLDLHMPDINGEHLGHWIKRDPTIAQTPLVLISSMTLADAPAHTNASKFLGHLTKPVKQSRLYDCLVQILASDPRSLWFAGLTAELPQAHSVDPQRLPLRILVAEDNVVNQKVTLRQLKSLGYTADIVANGQEALNMVDKFAYDVILMDCQMPVLDGYSATRQLRLRETEDRHTIVIAMTANAQQSDRERCLAAGMDDYISKPVVRDVLGELLQQWGQAIASGRVMHAAKTTIPLTEGTNMSVTPMQVSSSPAPINLDQLHQVSDGDEEFELELLQVFLSDAHSQLALISAAIADQDCEALARLAHRLKGGGCNVGADRVTEQAVELESAAQEKNVQECSRLIALLVDEVARIEQFAAARRSG